MATTHFTPRGYSPPAMIALGVVLAMGCQSTTRDLSGTRELTGPVAAASHGRTYAMLLNGGGKRQINFQSHLTHVKHLLALLDRAGVPSRHIVVFSGDGDDPATDLATRAINTDPWFWLLPRSGAGRRLRPSVTYINSVVDGLTLRPARRETLREWFDEEGARLRAGDTLLFYVTDHGDKNDDDLSDNTITLWDQTLSVSELRAMFDLIDPAVRIVMLMSQCFSGSFAHAVLAGEGGNLPEGNVCGYFASTAERPAYGCYPENRGKDGVGHSHEVLEALSTLGRLPEAHRRALVTDDTPDVPHTSADFFLKWLLDRAAAAGGRDRAELADELIARAWQHRSDWEPEIRLLDRIGQTFGMFSPRSLTELKQQAEGLPQVSERLATYVRRWRQALDALARENMRRFLDAHPEWEDRLEPKATKALDAEARRALAAALLAELVPYTERDTERWERLQVLKQRADDAAAARYRMEVRLGVVLRMRSLLTSIAGRVYLARDGTPAERAAYDRLLACEDLTLATPAMASAAALQPPERFPPLGNDQRLVEAVMPAWMGIHYRPLTQAQREQDRMHAGAVTVLTVYPDSPADAAGIKVGDTILGPPDAPFEEPNQVREWTMRHEIGVPAPLAILRDAAPLRVTLRPGPFPLKMPTLPGPPEIGSVAPPITADPFRGKAALSTHTPRLLFFWATWCLPCKLALPELLAFSEARNIEVVAITDEDAETLHRFFRDFQEPFPETVVIDRYRQTFRRFGVSGTPTFVLIGSAGTVQHYHTGYEPAVGLGMEGWQWKRPERVSQRTKTGTE